MPGEIVPLDQRREIVSASASVPAIAHEVQALRDMTAIEPSRFVRRLLFLWLRVYVLNSREGRREERVDVRIPIPIPLVGALFPRSIGWRQALAAIAAAHDASDARSALRTRLDASMAFEFVRVESERHGKRELVVVGLD